MTNDAHSIPDAPIRHLAETTFDRNVVVVAGAGTGKTTLLVNRLVHLLVREPRPVPLSHIVVLTFTNKAATEMKVRLRERLLALLAPTAENGAPAPGVVRIEELRARYGLSSDAIAARAAAALRELERAQIGTLHSFAAHLLRLYPIEGGVDPGFAEDDGTRFDEHFAAQWDCWLDAELGPQGNQHEVWRRALAQAGLEQVRALARALSSELVPLEELHDQLSEGGLSPGLRAWFAEQRARAAALLETYGRPKPRKVEQMLAAAATLFALVGEGGCASVARLEPGARGQLERDLGAAPAGWPEEAFAEATSLLRIAAGVLAADPAWIRELVSLLLPFAERVRRGFLEQGWISFDGLLARARALLRDHPAIRERLKQEYQALLVDEFQDTDPVQYELVLFLAERAGQCAPTWQEVELAPGKLFIVGDPKQSIYAFRRADIEAFERVVGKIREAGGVVYELVTNFRSHAAVIEMVNAVFARLLMPQPHVQPANVPLAVRPGRAGGVTQPGVELRLVEAWEEEEGEVDEAADAATATRLEADALAAWLKEELLAKEELIDPAGRRMPLQPGHVALLFRKLTQAQDYLEALRRHGIPYVTDGEKHFYRRQEVVDLVNLLRVVESPHDAVALVGVLRSPLGGVTDRELVELSERGALDYRRRERLVGWESPRAPAVRRLYERLDELHGEAAQVPLPEVVGLLFERLPVLELAAASLHGEQAVANLVKLRQMAAELADRPSLTLTGFVELLIARVAEQPDEAESALAEESLAAVRVLTIHKAKGLEFPVVVLPGLHHGTGGTGGTGEPAPVSEDWSSGVFGITVGGRGTLGAVLVAEKARVREAAERRRLFYVGMTRARERLVLSGGLPRRTPPGALLALLAEAAGTDPVHLEAGVLRIGAASLRTTVTRLGDRAFRNRPAWTEGLRAPAECGELAARWEERGRRWREATATPRRVTPSWLLREARGDARDPAPPKARPAEGARLADRAALVGTLAHQLLERWEFERGLLQLEARLAEVLRSGLPPEWEAHREGIAADLRAMMRAFAGSAPYADLQRATILGREVPFSIPWDEGRQVMDGVLDLLYRLDGRLWIADYKTDLVEEGGLERRAGEYRLQALAYREAVARALGATDVGFQFIFLRQGRAIQAT